MTTKEFLVPGKDAAQSRQRCLAAINAYAKGRKWIFLLGPETKPFTGRGKKFQGQTLTYARISVLR